MLNEALKTFAHFPDNARTWVYQADRILNDEEIQFIEANLANFTADWKAHGKPLEAKGKIIFERFLLIMVNENTADATGCSIDSSVHFVQQIGKTLMVDWFNRMKVVYQADSDALAEFDFRKADELLDNKTINAETVIFNNNVVLKGELMENWLVPIKQSWLARQLSL